MLLLVVDHLRIEILFEDVLVTLQNADLAVLIIDLLLHQDNLVAELRLVVDVDLFFFLDFVDNSLDLCDHLVKLWKVNTSLRFFLALLFDLEADAVDFGKDGG